jgi:O-antigen ligase
MLIFIVCGDADHNLYLAIGLERGYLLMPAWAALLAIPIGVFRKPTQRDRTFKFIRAASFWLLTLAP